MTPPIRPFVTPRARVAVLALVAAGAAGTPVGCVSAPSRVTPAPTSVASVPSALTPTGAAPVTPGDSPLARDLALRTFDSAWTIIRDSHYDPGMRGLDWDAVRAELRPRAASAATLDELRMVLGDMLDRLGESHFGLIPREVAEALDPAALRAEADSDAGGASAGATPRGVGHDSARVERGATDGAGAGRRGSADVPGDVGLTLRAVGAQVVVFSVDSGGPAALAGVRPGWVVERVGAYTAERGRQALAKLAGDAERREVMLRLPMSVEHLLAGPAGTSVGATFLDGTDRAVTLALPRRRTAGVPVKFGNLPTLFARLTSTRLARPGGCVGLIRFNIWMAPIAPELDRAMDGLRDCRGVVLDIRGNPGGIGGMVMGVAGYFLDEPKPLGVMRSRGTELRFVANPRRVNQRGESVRPYAGPLAILVDQRSASTSEIFAAGMQTLGRARIFGDTTAAQALPAVATALPSGDVLMHVIADFTAPDGRRIEGRGVLPDEVAPVTRAALLAGRDPALDAAVRWIEQRK